MVLWYVGITQGHNGLEWRLRRRDLFRRVIRVIALMISNGLILSC